MPNANSHPEAAPKRKSSDRSSASASNPKRQRNAAASDATPRRENLTLAEWLRVFDWCDQHPSMSQHKVVRYFKTLKSDPLFFTQPALSRKLLQRTKIETCVNDNPTALASKRFRAVRAPEVERALVLWVRRVEHKGEETITGPMLQKIREKFEEELGVPKERRLRSDGWTIAFRKAYNIQPHCGHGGAAPVDTVEVEPQPSHQTIPAQSAREPIGCDRSDSDGGVAEIAEQVRREMMLGANKESVGVNDQNDADEEPPAVAPSRTERLVEMCQQLEFACQCVRYCDPLFALSLSQQLRKFRGILWREELLNSTQAMLDSYFL